MQKIKRRCRPAVLLLITGFAISIASVLVGISTTEAVLHFAAEEATSLPVAQTMHNTGLSLAASVYMFSVVNCAVTVNYLVVSERRNFAVCKAFGWTNADIIRQLAKEISAALTVGLFAGRRITAFFSRISRGIITVEITPFLAVSTLVLLVFTQALSMAAPVAHILKIHPAQAVS